MIPLRDNIPSRTTPLINYAIIGITSVVFYIQLQKPELVEQFGMIPARVSNPSEPVAIRDARIARTPFGDEVVEFSRPALPSPIPAWLTPLSCILLHGGWMHFIGNMWFLYIFGDNVEDRFGHVGYLFFYMGTGVLASLTHLFTNSSSAVPTIGASGAIAGVMGAYFLLYPRANVLTLIPLFIFIEILVIPAPLFLGFWFLLQFFQGTTMKATGVAWWAHIGGFVAGLAIAYLLKRARRLRPRVETVRPHTDRPTMYRVNFWR